MSESLEIIFRSGWTFFGTMILLGMPLMLMQYFLRSRNIKRHGWPPAHIDADGLFKDSGKINGSS